MVSGTGGERVYTLEGAEHPYRVLVETMGEGALTLSADGTILYCNGRFAAMVGSPLERLIGSPLERHVPDTHRAKLRAFLFRSLEGWTREETALETAGGAPLPVLLSARSLEGLDSGGICAVVTDLTEIVAARDALREEEARFRSLLKDSLVGFFIVQGGRIVFMNPEAERIFGDVPESRVMKDFRCVHPDDRARFLSLREKGGRERSGKAPVDVRVLPPRDAPGAGPVRWAHCRASSVLWKGKAAVLVNTLDITRIKDLERLNLTQEKMAALGRVSAGIAHEIRNPLSGINLYLSALEKVCTAPEGLSGEKKEMAQAILAVMRSASEKIEGVIKKVLNYARPAHPRLASTDLNNCIGEALGLSGTTLRKKGIGVRKALCEALPRCRADARLIEQVVLNLVMNAAQAVEKAGGEKQVEIVSLAEGPNVLVKIGDSGPGIPAAIREKIFDPFYTTRKEGTGLGLTISRRIVHDHGGSISVGDSPLGGAEFRIVLPAEKT